MLRMDWLHPLRNSFTSKPRRRMLHTTFPVAAELLEERLTLGDLITPIVGSALAMGLMSDSISQASSGIEGSYLDFEPIRFSTDDTEDQPVPIRNRESGDGGGYSPPPETKVTPSQKQILPSVLDELAFPTPVRPQALPPLTTVPQLDTLNQVHKPAGVPAPPPPGLGGGTHASADAGGGAMDSGSTTTFAVMSFGGGQPPDARDDVAWTGLNQTITIEVIENDGDPDEEEEFAVIDAYGATKGVASVFDDEKVSYTPNPAFTSGTDTFTYVIEDETGLIDTAEVTVTMVEVSGWSMEWQDRDDQWNSGTPVTWSHEELRWRASASLSEDVTDVEFAAMDAEEFELGTGEWSLFASSYDPVENWTYGNPEVGTWAIMPMVSFQPENQTEFVATMRPEDVAIAAKPIRAEITSVQWVEHVNGDGTPSDEAGILIPESPGGVQFFPDAWSPGGPARDKVDVVVTVAPVKQGIPIALKLYDVDDPTDHDGGVDDDGATQGNNVTDNFVTVPDMGLPPAPALASESGTTDNNGKFRTTFDVNWIQPGNNWRVAVAKENTEFFYVNALSHDDQSRLWRNENGILNPNFDQGMDTTFDEDSTGSIHASEVLTAWRMLHLEIDSMGVVAGNIWNDTAAAVQDNGDGTSTVTLNTGLPDPNEVNRFQNGTLTDLLANEFTIRSNEQGTVIVDNLPDGTIPEGGGGPITLRDDDLLQDGDDIPMPDTTALVSALNEGFIEPIFEIGDHNDDVSFVRNVEHNQIQNVLDWDTRGDNSNAYWVAYILGAFQGTAVNDNDPDSELSEHGVTAENLGGSIIYLESLRDFSEERAIEPSSYERNTVVHEVGHALAKIAFNDPDLHPVTRWEAADYAGPADIRYLDTYLKKIRNNTNKPWS